MKNKSWKEKLLIEKKPIVKRIEKGFSDILAHATMLIATPKIVDDYIKKIPKGTFLSTSTIRKDLAAQFNADYTCPLTTGIFIRIVAEAAYEAYLNGMDIDAITPFWRVIAPGSAMAKKVSFGEKFITNQRKNEEVRNK